MTATDIPEKVELADIPKDQLKSSIISLLSGMITRPQETIDRVIQQNPRWLWCWLATLPAVFPLLIGYARFVEEMIGFSGPFSMSNPLFLTITIIGFIAILIIPYAVIGGYSIILHVIYIIFGCNGKYNTFSKTLCFTLFPMSIVFLITVFVFLLFPSFAVLILLLLIISPAYGIFLNSYAASKVYGISRLKAALPLIFFAIIPILIELL